jgi:predicted aspartyl protease
MIIETKCGFDDSPGVSGAVLLEIHGPTLFVDIGFDPGYKATAIPLTIPVSGIKSVAALVDTGASHSCIDNLLAASLSLPIIDRQPISGVAGRSMANIYLAQIHVPSLAFTINGRFAGVDLRSGGQQHEALIGRSFLRSLRMHYDGRSGTVSLDRDSAG